MKTLIYDESQVRKFYNEVILNTPYTEFDADFFCVAARKKYMTQEDKERTRLGDTTLLEKTPLHYHDVDIFYHKLQKVDASLDYLYSHNGANIPRSCMVFYMNINHTSMINALKNFKADVSLIENEIYDVFMKNGLREGAGNKLKRLDQVVLKSYQDPKNVSKRHWVDIDMDINPELISYEEVRDQIDDMIDMKSETGFRLKSENAFKIIQTHGGYHILVNTEMISLHNQDWGDYAKVHKCDFKKNILSVKDYIDTLTYLTKSLEVKEIKVNQNAMVPIPGTLQGEKEVVIY